MPGGRLVGTRVVLEYPSHTATDNLLMAAVLAKGTTVIENAAKEPEVADLAAMLCDMGAVVRAPEPPALRSRAWRRSGPPAHAVVPDRVVAATYLAAVGMAGGEVTIADARPEHMEMLLRKVTRWAWPRTWARTACGPARTDACWPPTWRRSRIRAWRPTTAPCSWRC